MAECELDGLRVRVIDTPGVYDTAKDKDDIMTEIAKVSLCDIVLDIISKPVPIVICWHLLMNKYQRLLCIGHTCGNITGKFMNL